MSTPSAACSSVHCVSSSMAHKLYDRNETASPFEHQVRVHLSSMCIVAHYNVA
jgi:hypothetical protein